MLQEARRNRERPAFVFFESIGQAGRGKRPAAAGAQAPQTHQIPTLMAGPVAGGSAARDAPDRGAHDGHVWAAPCGPAADPDRVVRRAGGTAGCRWRFSGAGAVSVLLPPQPMLYFAQVGFDDRVRVRGICAKVPHLSVSLGPPTFRAGT